MRRSTETQAKFENEAQMQPNGQKNRSDNRIANIATLDNGTMVEAFKYLKCCGLAKTSLVSKRFSSLICTHRHKLARIYVYSMCMLREDNRDPTGFKIFDKTLSPEEYNNWVIRNGYSKQIPPETQIAGTQSTQNERKIYRLWAAVNYYYKAPESLKLMFDARTELSHENWPVFQHFFRLLTDPLIFISYMGLPHQNDALNLLASAINPDYGRLQCHLLDVSLEDNMHNFISWIKGHVHCDQFCINNFSSLNYDKELLDFFVTGANCTSSIYLKCYLPCKLITRFVQKFMDLKDCNENKMVGVIEWQTNTTENIDALKSDYADFVVEGNINTASGLSNLVFEFVNNDIEKKLKLSISFGYCLTEFTLKVANL